jgi:tryptophanyl-tRNA synthetase
MNNKKIIFSGIQPSGQLNIANYIGAISQWIKMQEEYRCIFSIVDYHAITVRQDPNKLKERIKEVAKIYLAAGVDPEKTIIFQQSTVSAHTELAWIFNCYGARIADLNKMTQFKDKAGKNQESVSAGLYDYPVLMAADILLYDTEVVPVGEDQKQHVELAREIAKRFNHEFGDFFRVPQVIIKKEGAKIMSLLDPSKKMSKSDLNHNNVITLLEDVEIAEIKIIKAVTDSGSEIVYDLKNKPAISNLLTIYAQLGNREIPRLVKDYNGKGYSEFKKDLAKVIGEFLEKFQEKYRAISDDEVMVILEEGRKRAKKIADKKLDEVKRIIGIN